MPQLFKIKRNKKYNERKRKRKIRVEKERKYGKTKSRIQSCTRGALESPRKFTKI